MGLFTHFPPPSSVKNCEPVSLDCIERRFHYWMGNYQHQFWEIIKTEVLSFSFLQSCHSKWFELLGEQVPELTFRKSGANPNVFINSQSYDLLWHLEDRVEYTGRWSVLGIDLRLAFAMGASISPRTTIIIKGYRFHRWFPNKILSVFISRDQGWRIWLGSLNTPF